jgi:membrane protein YqaA with SNARE-associated domain
MSGILVSESNRPAEERMSPSDPPRTSWLGDRLAEHPRRLQLAALLLGLGLVAGATAAWLVGADITEVEYWKALGYPGVLIVSFVGAVGLVLPVPGLAAVCGAAGLDLNVIGVGLLAGLGNGAGEISGYAIGYGGRSVVERRAFYATLKTWMERRGAILIFVASAIPNPLFDLVGVAAGGTRYPVGRFMIVVTAGSIIKNVTVAWACSQGFDLLPWEF